MPGIWKQHVARQENKVHTLKNNVQVMNWINVQCQSNQSNKQISVAPFQDAQA